MNLELKKFDITSIKKDKVCVFIGKRETGKSFLVRDLLYYHQDVPIGTVISGTEQQINPTDILFQVCLFMINIHLKLYIIH